MEENYKPAEYPSWNTYTPIMSALAVICGYNYTEAMILYVVDKVSINRGSASGWVSISLPTMRKLVHFSASETTVRNAVRSLEARGWLEKKASGNGTPKYRVNTTEVSRSMNMVDITKTKYAKIAPDEELSGGVDLDPLGVDLQGGGVDLDHEGCRFTGEVVQIYRSSGVDLHPISNIKKEEEKLLSNSSIKTPNEHAANAAQSEYIFTNDVLPDSKHSSFQQFSAAALTTENTKTVDLNIRSLQGHIVEVSDTTLSTPTCMMEENNTNNKETKFLMTNDHDILSAIAGMYSRLKEKDKHDSAKGSAAKFMTKHGDRLMASIQEYKDLIVPAFQAFLDDEYWKGQKYPPGAFIKQVSRYVSQTDQGSQEEPKEREKPAFRSKQVDSEPAQETKIQDVRPYTPPPTVHKTRRKNEALDLLASAKSSLLDAAREELAGKSDLISPDVIEKWHNEAVTAFQSEFGLPPVIQTRSLHVQ